METMAEKGWTMCSYEMTQKAKAQGHERITPLKKDEKQRKCLSFKEKRAIIERYDMLPITMSRPSKAESLGLKYTSLLGILQQRDNIFSVKNTAMKKAKYGKEKEVE